MIEQTNAQTACPFPPNSLRLVNKAKFLGAFVVEGATRIGAVDAANPQPLQNKPVLQR